MKNVIDELQVVMTTDLRAKMGPDPSGELGTMPLARLLITYYNWRARFVSTQPRQAHISSELAADAKYVEHQSAINAIVTKIESGADLTGHLSRGISNAYQPSTARPAKHGPRKDLDLLQSEWSIHHLHLSTTIEGDGFVSRTEDLLFAIFQPDDAYLLGVFPHGAWTNTELVEAAVRNWPNAGLFHELRGAIGLANPIPPQDRPRLRSAGVTTMVEVDGKVYAPPGQTTAGTPMSGTAWSNQVMRGFTSLAELLDNLPPDVVDLADGQSKYIGTNPEWEAFAHGPFYGIRDVKSGATPFLIRAPD